MSKRFDLEFVMRRTARAVAMLGAVVALAVAGLLAFVRFAPPPSYPVQAPTLRVALTPERVAEGRRIVTMFCAACHADASTGRLTGKLLDEMPEAFGVFYSANITQDPDFGIGRYTDGEIAHLLRTGVKRDGHLAVPMPVLAGISDEDIAAIVAFLRSDDPLVAPARVAKPAARPTLIARGVLRFQVKPTAWQDGPATAPTEDPVTYGRYLAASRYDCQGCHTATLAGGMELRDAAGETVVSANLTPDIDTGLPGLTEDELASVLLRGFRGDNRPVRAPMPLFSQLTREEVHALYAYLRSVPAVRSESPRRAAQPTSEARKVSLADPGQQVYVKYGCQACHGTTGLGSCDLRSGARHFTSDAELVAFIKSPAASVPGSRMPGWDGVIAEEEYAALASYVRRLGAGAPVQLARN